MSIVSSEPFDQWVLQRLCNWLGRSKIAGRAKFALLCGVVVADIEQQKGLKRDY